MSINPTQMTKTYQGFGISKRKLEAARCVIGVVFADVPNLHQEGLL